MSLQFIIYPKGKVWIDDMVVAVEVEVAGTQAGSIKGKDDFRELQGCVPKVGEDLGGGSLPSELGEP